VILKINSKEVKNLLAAIDDLIEIKILVRQIVPNYNLDKELNKKFHSLLEALQSKLQPIFSKYLNQNNKSTPVKTREYLISEIKRLSGKTNLLLVSANSSKKKLKIIGIDPRNIIVSGGPLIFEDYKKLSPNIPDRVLPGIRKKCDTLLKQIKTINWQNKDFVFIFESENNTDKVIQEELELISEYIGKKVRVIEISSWKILEQ